jgi:hypothetical protein
MEPEARFTFIGTLLLALLLAAAAATIWLTRSGARADLRYYTIYFERQSLQGLQVGGDVEMRGVQVGRVERFCASRLRATTSTACRSRSASMAGPRSAPIPWRSSAARS